MRWVREPRGLRPLRARMELLNAEAQRAPRKCRRGTAELLNYSTQRRRGAETRESFGEKTHLATRRHFLGTAARDASRGIPSGSPKEQFVRARVKRSRLGARHTSAPRCSPLRSSAFLCVKAVAVAVAVVVAVIAAVAVEQLAEQPYGNIRLTVAWPFAAICTGCDVGLGIPSCHASRVYAPGGSESIAKVPLSSVTAKYGWLNTAT